MINLAQSGYKHNEIVSMLEDHRMIDFEYELLDKNDRVIKNINASATIRFDSESEIMGTANIEIMEDDFEKFFTFYIDLRIRPYFKLMTDRGWLKYPLGIYIITSPVKVYKNNRICYTADCYDKNIILKEDKFIYKYIIHKGDNYVTGIKSILASAGIEKHNIEASNLTANVDLAFPIGTSKLEAINDLLYAINYYPIHFDNNGTAVSSRYIEPMQRETEFDYMTDDKSVILSGATQIMDLYNVPNIVIRYIENPDYDDYLISSYYNTDPNSPFSIDKRGRNIVDIEAVDDIADQETLDAYTKRIAIEKSQINESVNLLTALMPHHGYRDCIFVRNDELKIQTKYIEFSWEMPLTVGASMSHILKKVVYLP